MPGKGRIECRPIRKGEEFCYFPLEVWKDRIGYLIIEFNETYSEGRILGFVPEVFNTIIAINHLQPLDSLLTVIHSQKVVKLSEWLNHIFTPAWQSLEEVFCSQGNRPILGFRSINNPDALINLLQTTQDERIRWETVERLRKIDQSNPVCGVERAIDLSTQFEGNAIALTVSILPKLDSKMAILVKVYTLNNHLSLPTGLQLIGLDEDGNTLKDIVVKPQDSHIQFFFTADIGDKFSLNVKLNHRSITEYFIV